MDGEVILGYIYPRNKKCVQDWRILIGTGCVTTSMKINEERKEVAVLFFIFTKAEQLQGNAYERTCGR